MLRGVRVRLGHLEALQLGRSCHVGIITQRLDLGKLHANLELLGCAKSCSNLRSCKAINQCDSGVRNHG